jgi:hypothetical protein
MKALLRSRRAIHVPVTYKNDDRSSIRLMKKAAIAALICQFIARTVASVYLER